MIRTAFFAIRRKNWKDPKNDGGEHELLSIPYRCIGLLNQSRMQG